jgi:hypothetical protein
MSLLLVLFAITTSVMHFAAKSSGYDPVGVHARSKWDISLNIKFLSDMRRNYITLGKPTVVAYVNFVSFYGFLVCFLLVIVTEFLRYY